MNVNEMIGKTVVAVEVDGFGVNIEFNDGTVFVYGASDGGYSLWDYDRKEVIEEE